jgi:hypothetical protein
MSNGSLAQWLSDKKPIDSKLRTSWATDIAEGRVSLYLRVMIRNEMVALPQVNSQRYEKCKYYGIVNHLYS